MFCKGMQTLEHYMICFHSQTVLPSEHHKEQGSLEQPHPGRQRTDGEEMPWSSFNSLKSVQLITVTFDLFLSLRIMLITRNLK